MTSLSEYEAWACVCGRIVTFEDEPCECGLTFGESED